MATFHERVVTEARAGLSALYAEWSKEGKIRPFSIVWASGGVVQQRNLEKERNPIRAALQHAKQNRAHAVLLCEQRGREVLVRVETGEGAVSWTIPVKKHGNVDVLDTPVENLQAERLGVIWD